MGSQGLPPPPGGIPIPEATQIEAKPAPIPQDLTGQDFKVEHPGATSKAGGVAYIADKFLKGWMAGRYMGQEKQMQQARQQVADARTTVDVAGQAYQTLKSQGKDDNDPDVARAKTALNSAWSNYLGMAKKYVTPEPDQKKPGVGKRVKDAMSGGSGPHLFLQSSLSVLDKVDPTVFYGEDANHAQQRQLQQAQLQEVKRKQNYEQTLAVPEDKRTPQQRASVEAFERAEFGPKPAKAQAEDQFYKDVASGASKNWTPDQKNLATNLGILHRDQFSFLPETVTDAKDYRKQHQVVHVMNEQGQEVSTIKSPFVNVLPPDHYQTAQQVLDGQFAVWKKHFKAAGYDAKTSEKMSVEAMSKGKWNDVPSANDNRLTNDALHYALSSIQKKYKADHPGAAPGDISAYMDKFQSLVTQGPNGQLIYDGSMLKNPKLTYEEPGFIKQALGYLTGKPAMPKANPPSYAGGAQQSELGPMENQLRSSMRDYLDRQKGLNPTQADRIMGNPLVAPYSSQAGMTPPPGGAITPPPGGAGQKLYSLTINGETYQRWMTEQQAAAVGRNQSVKVSPIGGTNGVESSQGPPEGPPDE